MGFKGDYLFAGHTREHVRELWQAKLGETGTYDGWLAAGAPAPPTRRRRKSTSSWPPRRLSFPTSWLASSRPSSPRRSARLPGMKRNRLKSSARDHPAL